MLHHLSFDLALKQKAGLELPPRFRLLLFLVSIALVAGAFSRFGPPPVTVTMAGRRNFRSRSS